MNRRSAIKSVVFFGVTGGIMLSCGPENETWPKSIAFKNLSLTAHHKQLLEALTTTLLPIHNTKGWENISVLPMALQLIDHCYSQREVSAFVDGLKEMDKKSRLESHKPFLSCNDKERMEMLKNWEKKIPESVLTQAVALLKKELLFSLSTTEPYLRKIKMYEMAPARYKACLPIEQVTTLNR